jgi:hypothetical protein
MDILDKIESKHYVANEAQIEGLANECYKAGAQVQRTDGIYLRVLIAGCQAQLGSSKRGRAPNAESQLAVVEQVHERFYAAVLRGVTTPDVANEANLEAAERNRRTLERNRRSNFARQSKSTLAAYATAGGDIRAIEVATVTKGSLRAATPASTATGPVGRIQQTQEALIRAVVAQAKVDPGGARAALEEAMAEFQRVLDSLDGEPDHVSTTTVVGRGAMQRAHTRSRAGVPQMHRGV